MDLNRGHVYHTLNNEIIDLRHIDYDKPQNIVEIESGWEAAMYWSNIAHKELDNDFFIIEEGDVFVDLGANIGMSSTYAELKGASKIYCAEPDPNIFACLEKNKSNNWVTDNVAITDYNGEYIMGLWPHTENRFVAKCITFEDFIKKHNITKIDYLKIDIEGGEYDLITSILPETWDITRKIFIEYHENIFHYNEQRRTNLIKIILNYGFSKFHVRLGTHQTMLYFWK